MDVTAGTGARSHVVAIDQGTTSTRCLVFDHQGRITGRAQVEHRQHLPRPGWVEHDPTEIWAGTRTVVAGALAGAGIGPADVAAAGVTNQRETVVVWDRRTGTPVHRAIVWQDVRTQALCDALAGPEGDADRYRERTGLPIATYFAGPKIRWILDHVAGARAAAERGELLAGTIDTWLLWNLTGGSDGGIHITDVTNASRTLLMDLSTLSWDAAIAADVGVPLAMLPRIRSSSEVYGHGADDGPLPGVPISGVLGDQQAALFGQTCFGAGEVKNTYGTGSFVLAGTGATQARSAHGLVTTVAYRLGDGDTAYALEGSIAVTGSLVQWLRDNLGLISSAAEVEALAAGVPDTGGVYVVPAFSGLFAPHWRPDARGTVVGMTRYTTKAHLARAALEATAFQTREVLDAVEADTGITPTELRVDGGMAVNDLLLQMQADVLGIPVIRPIVTETTALGAAYAAGLAVGFWPDTDALRTHWQEERRFEPSTDDAWRQERMRWWHKAVQRSLGWAEDDDTHHQEAL